MVVAYTNTDFFKILIQRQGSIFDNVFLKLVITFIISMAASWAHDDTIGLGWFNKKAAGNQTGTGAKPINSLGFTLAGSAIAFLLVFRSSISYNRFWEGRGHLGAIMHHARDFGRQVAFCLLNDEGEGERDIMKRILEAEAQNRGTGKVNLGEYQDNTGVRECVHRMCGFRRLQMIRVLLMYWRLLAQHTQGQTKPEDVKNLVYSWAERGNLMENEKRKIEDPLIKKLAIPTHAEVLAKQKRRPLVAIAMLTWYLQQEYRAKNITYMEYLSMNDNLNGLVEGFNGVDKICSVPLPFPYAQMILIFLSLYCFCAPFLFVASFGWATFVPSIVLSLAFFGINEVAVEIEEPFGDDDNDLPTDGMGDALTQDCEMNCKVAGVPVGNTKFYWEEIAHSFENSASKKELHSVQRATGMLDPHKLLGVDEFAHPLELGTNLKESPFLLQRPSRRRDMSGRGDSQLDDSLSMSQMSQSMISHREDDSESMPSVTPQR